MFRFFKDFFVYGVASLLGKIVAVFLMPVYTNILTKEEYGAMALITSVQGLIGLVSNLNIHSGIARDYYEDGINRRSLVSTGFFSIISLSLTIMVIGLFSRHFWGKTVLGLNDSFLPAFTVMLINIPAGSLLSFFAILTRFKKKPLHYSFGTLFQLLIQIAVSVIGVVVLRIGIISVFLGILSGELFALVYFAILNRDYIRFEFNNELLRRALVFALPTLPAILAGWLDNSMGQILIGKYVSVADLGVYSVALQLASVFTLISTAFQNVWSPFLYENYNKPEFNRDIRRLFSIISLMLLLITVFFSFFAREIILLLSNEGYLSAGTYLILLCIPMSFYLLFPFASSGILISRDTKMIGISYIVGSCLNLFTLLVTIRYLGVIAVPICLALSRVLSYLILYRASRKRIGFKLPNIFLIFLAAVAFFGVYIIKLNLSLLLRVCLTFVLLASLLLYISKRYNSKAVLYNLMHLNK